MGSLLQTGDAESQSFDIGNRLASIVSIAETVFL
jgi:hypothetical protein